MPDTKEKDLWAEPIPSGMYRAAFRCSNCSFHFPVLTTKGVKIHFDGREPEKCPVCLCDSPYSSQR